MCVQSCVYECQDQFSHFLCHCLFLRVRLHSLQLCRFMCVWLSHTPSPTHARNPLKDMQQSLNTNPINGTAGRQATTSVMWSPEDRSDESTSNKLVLTARRSHMSSVWKHQPQLYCCVSQEHFGTKTQGINQRLNAVL